MSLQITGEFKFAKQMTRRLIYATSFMVIVAASWMSVLLSNANAASADHFVTTWRTDNPGASNNTSITIPTNGGGYNYDIDWDNDGIFDQFGVTNSITHDFGTPGEYTIRIQGQFPKIYFMDAMDQEKIIRIDQWGTGLWANMDRAFYGAKNVTSVATDAPNLSATTNMNYMFAGASNFNGDLSNWDVSNVTSMNGVFMNASSFNGNISTWNTSNVTDMRSMFAEATAFNANITNWDVSKVTTMSGMFRGARAFNRDLAWNVSSVTDMSHMFSGAASFDGDISDWDVSNVTDMNFMFGYFNGDDGASTFTRDISDWDVSSVTNMSGMFYRAYDFNGNLSSWNVSEVTNMNSMFSHAYAFNSDISSWDVSSVTSMIHMFGDGNFGGGTSAFNQDISNWDVSSVTNMSGMFFNSESFDRDLNSWNTSSVTNMTEMFNGASAFSGDISLWNTSNVTSMAAMFNGVNMFNSDISSWDVSNVTDMSYMFYIAGSFDQDISSWDVSTVASMEGMFLYSGLSVENYDALLASWSQQPVQSNVSLGVEPILYCNSESARSFLIQEKGWVITDGGKCTVPVVTSLSPSQVIVSESEKIVTIYGSGFQQGATVTVGGETAAIYSVGWDGASIEIVAPVSATLGSVTVVVTNPGGTSVEVENGLEYIARPAPTAESPLQPHQVELEESGSVYIYGDNFGDSEGNAPTVSIGGKSSSVLGWSSTYLHVSIPSSDTSGTVDVIITNPDGQSVTISNFLQYYEVPDKGISSVNFIDEGGKSYLIIEGASLVSDSNETQAAMVRSLVTLNGVSLPFCNMYAASGMNKEQFIQMMYEGSEVEVDPQLISDEPICYEIMDISTQTFLLTPEFAVIWIPESFDKSAMGTVSVNGSPVYTFNAVDEDPITPTIHISGTAPLDQNPEIAKRPTFSGAASPGAVVTVTVNSDPVSCTTTADSSGNWSCTLPSDLVAGAHTVTVRVVNLDGSIQELGPYAVTVAADGSGGAVTDGDTPGAPNTGFLAQSGIILKQFQDGQQSAAVATSAVLGAGAALLLGGAIFGGKTTMRRLIQSVKK